jgi:hypothetical protein
VDIRGYIGAIARSGAEQDQQRGFRKLLSGAARLATTNPAKLVSMTAGMGKLLEIEQNELALWVDPGEKSEDGPSKFDVCDLRIWLEIAQAAGIDAIPAQTVATLSEDELGALLGPVGIPNAIRNRIGKGLMEGGKQDVTPGDAGAVLSILENFDSNAPTGDPREAGAKAFSKIEGALDEIPASWMVRTHLSGSGNLKALVGCGIMSKGDDTAKIRPDFEIGAGWVRAGNRRLIDFSDPRFVELAVGGHKSDVHYLARPWAAPGRFHEGEDLHRANTPLAGPGKWPAEWRVFVKGGEVSGVANYYGWTGEGATPENAWNAIESAAAGQAVVDEATDQGMVGVFMAQVFIRESGKNQDAVDLMDKEWPQDKMNCTIDFLETVDGIQFLEAGPAHQIGGGGHPCAFAGQGMSKERSVALCEGVAYLTMPHVHLGEPDTWYDGDPEGYIDGWQPAVDRAVEYAPLSDRAVEFIKRKGCEIVLNDLEP